ncbi:MAG: serine/threonine-protein kinase HipA [Colwellia sp.]|jgi:serine/threonine-protein kinase HipA
MIIIVAELLHPRLTYQMISKPIQTAYVYIEGLDKKPVICGAYQLDINTNLGHFIYGKTYLARLDAFPLDPINLPLIEDAHIANTEMFGVFRDAGPDSWGRRIMLSLHKTKPKNEMEFLLAGAGEGVGALTFSLSRTATKTKKPKNQLSDIDTLINIKQALVNKTRISPEALKVLGDGSSMMIGGARPKTTLVDGEKNYIVKFNRDLDLFDNVMAEHATMVMLGELDVNVSTTRALKTELGNVLLVERFDMKGMDITSHFLSANSLLESKTGKIKEDDSKGFYTYGALSEVIRHEGHAPEQAQELYQRMVFNAFIGNVDDHTRNHALLYNFASKGWFLSPAYDVLPVNNSKLHSLGIGDKGREASLDNLLSQSKRFGVRLDVAKKIIKETRELVSSWKYYFENMGVSLLDIEVLKSIIPDVRSW